MHLPTLTLLSLLATSITALPRAATFVTWLDTACNIDATKVEYGEQPEDGCVPVRGESPRSVKVYYGGNAPNVCDVRFYAAVNCTDTPEVHKYTATGDKPCETVAPGKKFYRVVCSP